MVFILKLLSTHGYRKGAVPLPGIFWFSLLVSHLVTSGGHCTVRLGHSRACVITRSYDKWVFFFQILYSSLMTRSSIVSFSTAGREGMNRWWRG